MEIHPALGLWLRKSAKHKIVESTSTCVNHGNDETRILIPRETVQNHSGLQDFCPGIKGFWVLSLPITRQASAVEGLSKHKKQGLLK